MQTTGKKMIHSGAIYIDFDLCTCVYMYNTYSTHHIYIYTNTFSPNNLSELAGSREMSSASQLKMSLPTPQRSTTEPCSFSNTLELGEDEVSLS